MELEPPQENLLTTYERAYIIYVIYFQFSELFCKNVGLVNVESSSGQRHLSAWLGALLNFTATTTWNVFQKPAFSNLAPGMEKLCQNFLNHLLTGTGNLMQTMKILLLKGLAGSASCKSNLKKTTLTAIMTLVTRPVLTEKHLSAMILHIFSVPGLVYHCGPDLCKNLLIKNGIFGQIIGKHFF